MSDMFTGFLSGIAAAFLNAAGYLFSAHFLKKYGSAWDLQVSAQINMLLLSLPLVWFFYPGPVVNLPEYIFYMTAWVAVFFIGQLSFFMALKYIEASRLSSLLGLKIIVLTVIFMITARLFPNIWKWLAIFIAAAAAVMINWQGNGKINFKGGIFLTCTLICYSFSDICETGLIACMVDSGYSPFRGALFTTSAAYIALGCTSLPALIKVKITRIQLAAALPYSLLWILSQVFLMVCFAKVAPVFGNVILASRGLFSVVLGGLLMLYTGSKLDADISPRQWLRRGIAAIMMILAIAIYSWAAQP